MVFHCSNLQLRDVFGLRAYYYDKDKTLLKGALNGLLVIYFGKSGPS